MKTLVDPSHAPITSTLLESHTHIYPRKTHGMQHVYWCSCVPLQSGMTTYDIAPSTEMNTCPAPVFATGEATVRSVFDYAGKLP